MAPARAVTSPSLATTSGTSPISFAARMYMSFTFASNLSFGTLRKSEATIVRLSI